MTREEARIKMIEIRAQLEVILSMYGLEISDVFDIVIKALEREEPCEDCISREFIELVVEYPDPDLCTYPEYRGKPYFSIKYRENGKYIVGYGSYKIEMISQWIKEYFMPSIQPKPKTGHWKYVTDKTGHWVWECDKCGWQQRFNTKFCPDCGAQMESEG